MYKNSLKSAMREPALTVAPSDSISYILKIMKNNNIGSVIVTEDYNPIGIITEKDIVERVIFKRDPEKTFANEIMTSPVLSIGLDSTLTEALKCMRENNVRRLVVTKEGKAVGILTERRILSKLK